MQRNQYLLHLTLALGALAFGCGDDDGGSSTNPGGGMGSTVNSGVDDSKMLSMLTSAEVQQLGEGVLQAQSGAAFLDGACKFAGVLSSAAIGGNAAPTPQQVQMCNDTYIQCKTDSQSAPAAPVGPAAPTGTAAFAGCNITVAQYETCMTELLDIYAETFGALACDQPLDLSAMPTPSMATACDVLSTQCSGALPE